MNGVILILFLVAAFHFCLYYCNIDFFTKKTAPVEIRQVIDPAELDETKETLEKHLNELKQISTITTHG